MPRPKKRVGDRLCRCHNRSVSLASIILASGRDIQLDQLEVNSTYGGMLEGYPCARINDMKLSWLAKRRESAYWTAPVHLITPPRRTPDTEAGSSSGRPGPAPGPFGPVEILPAVHCRGHFSSHPVAEESGLYLSYLEVVWFQDDLSTTLPEFVTAAVDDLAWDALAEDREI